LVEGILVEEEAIFAHTVVKLTTLLMSVIKNMDILLDKSIISLKVQPSTMQMM